MLVYCSYVSMYILTKYLTNILCVLILREILVIKGSKMGKKRFKSQPYLCLCVMCTCAVKCS